MITSSFPRYEGDYFGPWILDYCRELKNQGVQVFVVAPKARNIERDLLSEPNLQIRRFNYWWPRSAQNLVYPPGMIPQLKANILRIFQLPFLLWAYYMTALNICKENEIDIIHCQWVIPSGFIGALLKHRVKRPLVITSQGAELFLSLKHPFSWITKRTIKHTDKLLPVSNQMAKRALFFGAQQQNMEVITNAVDIDKFRAHIQTDFREKYDIPEQAIVILTVRRLVSEKRVEDVLSAIDLVSEKQSIFLIIAGDGPKKEDLLRISNSMNKSDKILFTGFVDNKELPSIYAASDIYILSSQQEGLSLSMLEALASELIVISTKNTGGNEVIVHGDNGFLYDVGDINALARIINVTLAMTSIQRQEIGDRAREKVVGEYSLSSMVERWIKLYNNLLEKND